MKGSLAKTVARQVGMLGALTAVVAVLTFLFNLVGTLCVSIIAGMMAGASRRFNGQIIAVSLVPPIVALALGYVTKVEFDLRQWLSVAGICLGSFWGTWTATYLLMFLEKKSEPATSPLTSRDSTTGQEFRTSHKEPNESPGEKSPTGGLEPAGAEKYLKLEDLQGTWLCQTDRTNESPRKRIFVVTQDKFSLSILNSSGDTHLVAHGEVAVRKVDGKLNMVISASPEFEGEHSGGI